MLYTMLRTQIYLSEGQTRELDRRARARGTTRSAVIREALERYLAPTWDPVEFKAALHGVFAVKCFGAATRGLEGVASLGINPAVADRGPATLEAFLFDFSGDLYGRRLTIEFVKKLRDEAHFASLDELAAQIQRDCDAARDHFRACAIRPEAV